ncbi:MAG: helix-turn-helix transcriptional regulator [Euzebyaceae bacterium]|nr:helix-turn-helix transcriptional regulator [Euzebyaceae bacterium]
MNDIGWLLRQARRRAGLTQVEIARRAGTSQPTLSAHKRGRRHPTPPPCPSPGDNGRDSGHRRSSRHDSGLAAPPA